MLPAAFAWKRAARAGALVGLAFVPAFFLLHAAIVEPIWTRWDAWARGVLLAPLAGAVVGVALERLAARGEPRFAHDAGGLLLGVLAALALLPFAFVGWLRARGAPDPFSVLVLGLLLASWYYATQAAQATQARAGATRARPLELPALLLLANAFPAFFLTFIGDFHEETPEPFAFTFAVGALYLASGAALTLVLRRELPHTPAREHP